MTLMYYVFTTMTTVGFGDIHPESDLERLFCVVLFLFAGGIFSMILNAFTEMIKDYETLTEDIDEGDNFDKFWNLMTHFNKDIPYNENLKENFDKYFAYRWRCDKNAALDDEDEIQLMEKLPEEV